MTYSAGKLCQIPIIYLYIKHILHKQLHSRVKSISTLRYFPIYFILNHLFSTHSPEVRRVAPYTPTRSCVHIGMLKKK